LVLCSLMWGGSRVTVKELSFQPQQNSWKLRLADLLLAEQEHSRGLLGFYPMAILKFDVMSSRSYEVSFKQIKERNFWASFLFKETKEFPVLQTETILHVLLQILDALRFLHSRGFIHRCLSSFAIQIVSSGEGKLCNLEYMIESKDSGKHSDLTRIPVPAQLFRWSSPEIILEKPGTVKSDVYSFCAVLQEALTESLPWKGVEESAVKQLILSGEQLEADVRLPLLYYDVVKSGLEPKQRNRSMKLQDIQYILKNDLKDLVKSESGHAGGTPKAQRSAVLADVNICWASAFSFQKRTVEFQEKEISKAGGFSAPKDSVFPRESSAVVVQEAAASAEPPGQDRSVDVSSELQRGASPSSGSDVDGSLCSFEMNEILASYPEGPQDFLEGGPGSGQALKDAERQQMEDQSQWEGEEEGESSGSSTTVFTGEEEEEVEEEEEEVEEEEEEEEERVREASGLSQVRGDAGRRLSSPSQSEQHISRCVLNLKIMQSMLQQAGHSLSRTEEKLDRLKAMAKQKKLLQEVRMNLLPKESSQGRHWDGSDATSQNTKKVFSGVDIFLHQAVAPPSRDYIPPPVTCQAPGRDSFQAVPKTAKEREAIQNEKWKSKIATTHRDPGCGVGEGLDDEVSLNQEGVLNHGLLDSFQHFLPHVSARCQRKFSLQCQRGADSHPAARREEEKWCHSKPRVEFCSKKNSEKRRVMQSGWRTEVKQMARRVASGQLGLSCPYPASECTSESEAESAKESPQRVPGRVPQRQGQQRGGWQPGEAAEPWHLGSEDRSDSGDSDLEPALRTSTGRSCQPPAPDEQAEPGISIPKSSVLPQQAGNLSRGHSRELHCSLNSPPDVTEEFFTPDYFLPPALEGRSEPEVKITFFGHYWNICYLYSGGKILFCSTAPQSCGSNKLGVNQLSQMTGASVDAAREATPWEPQEECQEKDVSVADIQDLSSIPCEQNFQRGVECKTPRLSHAPTSVSTPLGSEEKFPLAFEKYKQCREFSSDSSFCGSQETSSTGFKTFTTACEGERSMEIPVVAPRVCPFALKEPFTFLCFILFDLTQAGLPPVASSLRNTTQAPEASPPSVDELPPPAQELLDEIEHLKQQDSITADLEGMGLQDSGVQVNALDQVQMENRESGKESERNEKTNQSLWTKESFNLAEDTERAHSSLDDILERMLHAVPGDEEIQEQ
ncbi:TEX14 kinase, partial [Ploceus nigricollis]|nr:TEX14 kinase [Ploceus nigricollis]